ncbi:MAG: sugar-binding domain-containing protein [bacterium]
MKWVVTSAGFFFLFFFIIVRLNRSDELSIPYSGAVHQAKNAATLSLAGKWKFTPGYLKQANLFSPGIDRSDWQEMAIPSNWFLQGHDLDGVVWFRRDFKINRKLQGKQATLVFEGVDYAADVWLNGHYLGFHEGYFQPFSFNVSAFLRYDRENALVVRVNSPNEETGRVWSLRKRLIKGIFNHHDTRPGGAWSTRGQEKNTGGIWAPVYLQFSEKIAIKSVRITPILKRSGKEALADIVVWVANAEKKAQDFVVDIELAPHNFEARNASPLRWLHREKLAPGGNLLHYTLQVDNPYLWWPWEHGEPHLYRLTLTFLQGDSLLDRKEEIFGFREVKCDPKTLSWEINGKKFFLRGTNYISTQWLSEMTPGKYARDIEMMQRANINIVRVHAHIEAQAFYRLCDEAGMLVWQDFPLQWGYTDEAGFAKEAVRQAKDMVAMLYNHPAIVTWCLHNEPPWDAAWMKYLYPEYDPEQNRELDEKLYASICKTDRSRHVHKISSTKEHPWLGWYSGSWKDYGKPATVPLITEYGAQALPDLPSLKKIFSKKELWPDNEAEWAKWSYHNFQKKETFEIAKVPRGKNIEQFIENTQQYQARLTQFAAESYRRQKDKPVTGIFQFMFVEDWPSVNWGIVDYWRHPKPGYEALRVAYQPVLPSIVWEKDSLLTSETVSLDVWVINDLWQEFPRAKLVYALHKKSKLVVKDSIDVAIVSNQAKKTFVFSQKELSAGKYSFFVNLIDEGGESLGKNAFSFMVVKK